MDRKTMLVALRSARQELEKQASLFGKVSVPWKGMGFGGVVGAGEAAFSNAGKMTRYGKGLAATRGGGVLDDAERAWMEENKHLGGLFDDAGKAKPLKDNLGEYAKTMGPDIAKRVAGWAGAGGLAEVGANAAKDYGKYNALKQYAPAAAAGVGGLLAYKVVKD